MKKLKSKHTGMIGELLITDKYYAVTVGNDTSHTETAVYTSLDKLNEDWEDYEEQKEYWYIDYDGGILCGEKDNSSAERMMISMGNHFESLEEAEKAVEKLKAWKRLKDKGFRFDGIAGMENRIYFKANEQFTHIMIDEYTADKAEKEYIDDLMLLFGGEE